MTYMKVTVEVKPNAREEKVEKLGNGHFRVAVKEPPRSGRANRAMEAAIAHYFGVAPSLVVIAAGHTAKTKIVVVARD